MRWGDERYVRFYTRNSPEWCLLSWQARGLFGLILREVDRAGILPTGKLGLKAVAVAVRATWDEIEKPLSELILDGCVTHRDEMKCLVVPNFLAAQEAHASDRARQRAMRERARDFSNASSLGVTETSQGVTHGHDANGLREKSSPLAVPSRAVPSRAVPVRDKPTTATAANKPPSPAEDIERAIRRFRLFDPLDAPALAEHHAGRMLTDSQRVSWVVDAIELCAAKHDGLGLMPAALQSRLVGFMRHARAPRADAEPVKVIESRDDPEILAAAIRDGEARRKKYEKDPQ